MRPAARHGPAASAALALLALGAALAILGPIGPAPAQDDAGAALQPNMQGTIAIHITSADYGHGGTLKDCQVTEAVRRACEGKQRCIVDVNDSLCPPPGELPAGLILTLSVHYKCQATGPTQLGAADKPFQVVVACKPGKP